MEDLVIGSVWASMSPPARGYIHVAPAPAASARAAIPVPATAAEMLSALSSDSYAWGDVLVSDSEVAERVAATTWYSCEDGGSVAFDPVVEARAAAARAAVAAEAEAADTERQHTDLFAQPFAANLDWSFADIHNTTRLTDEEWVACMTWLYDQGWEVVGENRAGFKGWPADLPPSEWAAPVTETRQWSQTTAPAKPKKAVTVPRFCRASAGGVPCADEACRYVHEDTMPRINEPCAFGAACGGTDPSKRALCIRMHPGETWSADLVVRRP